MATPISGAAQKYFLRDVKGKLCSKFGDDQSKTGLTMLAVVAGWTDTGRTDAKVNLYSVQCCRLHWTDNNGKISNLAMGRLPLRTGGSDPTSPRTF